MVSAVTRVKRVSSSQEAALHRVALFNLYYGNLAKASSQCSMPIYQCGNMMGDIQRPDNTKPLLA